MNDIPPPGDRLYTDVDGVRIHYTRAGTGKKHVVLIHGFGSWSFTWEGIQKAVPPDYSAWALDLPGFGYSDRPEDYPYGIDAFSQTILKFMAKQQITRAVVAGNSMGGMISLWLAAMGPPQVLGVVPIDAGGLKLENAELPIDFLILKTPVLGPLLFRIPAKPMLRATIKQVYGHKDRVKDQIIDSYYVPGRFAGSGEAWHLALRDLFRLSENGEFAQKIQEIHRPVSLLWGEKDPWIKVEVAKKFQSLIPGSKLKIYPDLGHVPMEEDPAQVAPDIYGFAEEVHLGTAVP